jgi:anti-sigma factor ChrR (cupin superfamily)
MHINDDLSAPVVVHAAKLDWVPSPAAGVERRMLFRIGEERARATSIVRYAPHSRFPRHGHPGGEEFFVLEGTFQDETGAFPAGSYIRNPPGTGHAPGSDEGCTIFVKLWQFRDDDHERIVRLPGEGRRAEPGPGALSSLTLFESPHERVGIEEWQPGAAIALSNPRGLEMLVLSGSFSDGKEEFERLSWLRLPAGKDLRAQVGPNGARIWFKSARLLQERLCEF